MYGPCCRNLANGCSEKKEKLKDFSVLSARLSEVDMVAGHSPLPSLRSPLTIVLPNSVMK